MTDDLHERLSALERVVAGLVENAQKSTDEPPAGTHWALDGLRSRTADTTGAVLYTGAITLPSGENYQWQYGRTLDDLLAVPWADHVPALAALGNPVRLRLLQKVLSGTHSVAELADDPDLGTTGQLYHHLRQLAAAGWLRSPTRGQYVVPGERTVPLLVIIAATL